MNDCKNYSSNDQPKLLRFPSILYSDRFHWLSSVSIKNHDKRGITLDLELFTQEHEHKLDEIS